MKRLILLFAIVFFSLSQPWAFKFKREVNGKEKIFYVKNDPVLKQLFEYYNLLYFDNKIQLTEVGYTDFDGYLASTYYYPSSKKVVIAISKPRTDQIHCFRDLTKTKNYDWLICHELIHAYLVQFEEPDLTHTSTGWKRKANWFRKEKGINIVDN